LGPPPADAWPQKDTTFLRIIGGGSLPQLDTPATYELCLDDERRTLVAVRALDGVSPVDERMAAALRNWSWFTFSSSGSPGGTSCWHVLFTPVTAADGHKLMQASVADPLLMLELLDDHELIRTVKAPEGEHVVAAIRVDDRGTQRLVVLKPSIGVDDPTVATLTRPSSTARRPTVPIPERFRRRHVGSRYRAIMHVCAEPSGSVVVGPIVPVLGVNSALIESVKTWRFPPDKLRWCGAVQFRVVP
jgi:hypothetical protein